MCANCHNHEKYALLEFLNKVSQKWPLCFILKKWKRWNIMFAVKNWIIKLAIRNKKGCTALLNCAEKHAVNSQFNLQLGTHEIQQGLIYLLSAVFSRWPGRLWTENAAMHLNRWFRIRSHGSEIFKRNNTKAVAGSQIFVL